MGLAAIAQTDPAGRSPDGAGDSWWPSQYQCRSCWRSTRSAPARAASSVKPGSRSSTAAHPAARHEAGRRAAGPRRYRNHLPGLQRPGFEEHRPLLRGPPDQGRMGRGQSLGHNGHRALCERRLSARAGDQPTIGRLHVDGRPHQPDPPANAVAQSWLRLARPPERLLASLGAAHKKDPRNSSLRPDDVAGRRP